MAVHFSSVSLSTEEIAACCDKAKEIMSKIKYKPGWSWQIAPYFTGVIITIFFSAVDVTNPPVEIAVGGQVAFSKEMLFEPKYYEKYILQELYSCYVKMERHEASEWFTYKGKAIFNEHELPVPEIQMNLVK